MQRRRDRRVLVSVERQVEDLASARLFARACCPHASGDWNSTAFSAWVLLPSSLALSPVPSDDEAGGVDLAVVEVGDLGAQQVALGLGVARRDHVADQQRAADGPVRLDDRGDRHAGHAVRDSVQMSLVASPRSAVPTAGYLDRRSSPYIALTFRSRAMTLPVGVDDRDDVGLARAARLQEAVELLALLEGGLRGAPVSSVLSKTPTTAGRWARPADQVGELQRFEARDVAVHPLRAGDVGFDVANDRLFELAGDDGVNAAP